MNTETHALREKYSPYIILRRAEDFARELARLMRRDVQFDVLNLPLCLVGDQFQLYCLLLLTMENMLRFSCTSLITISARYRGAPDNCLECHVFEQPVQGAEYLENPAGLDTFMRLVDTFRCFDITVRVAPLSRSGAVCTLRFSNESETEGIECLNVSHPWCGAEVVLIMEGCSAEIPGCSDTDALRMAINPTRTVLFRDIETATDVWTPFTCANTLFIIDGTGKTTDALHLMNLLHSSPGAPQPRILLLLPESARMDSIAVQAGESVAVIMVPAHFH